jgi:eukaryotic translation initiation factor 2C
MKVNAKLGGTTCKAIPKYKTVKKDGKVVTECSHPWYPQFQTKRIVVIGADVSHPSPGSPQGSMAALTMSMDKDMLRYAAGVQTNGYRKEIITKENIKALLVPMMQKWAGEVSNGAPPDYVFYFRDGVSEGQYQSVLQEEVMWMRYAIRDFVNPKWPKMPWTVIICSKRHHLRFFPVSDKKSTNGDVNGNPKPGTLIERDITHPFEYDFCKCSGICLPNGY